MRHDSGLRIPAGGAGGKVDIVAGREGGLAWLSPISEQGQEWLADNVGAEATWCGESLIVELRYLCVITEAIGEAGLTLGQAPG